MQAGTNPLILDGKTLAREIRESLKARVAALKDKGIHPRIEAVVAAQDPASLAYVRMKQKWAELAGIESGAFMVTESVSQAQILEKVHELNADPRVHGVLIQHPLPKHLDEDEVLQTLGAEKDVDGITSQSLGLLTAGLPGFRCATPLGIITLLDHYNIDCTGKNALVIGRSNILGKPMALMLLQKNATVTIAHRHSQDLPALCSRADILVAAVGRADLVKGDWLKPGVVVIDAGYNKVEGRATDVGDCEFESCAKVASAITPVPGGVGPMTVASLLRNTVDAAEATQA
ncbi:bifunctional 5,10-methylenetetrahydrofolate dehydrogenase/5,10-methenyltetrahydrofolate cyclohydrolase [Kamptonema cortianum]|nr:bifunctional 5,10-methylenetetrahydrofolate dehydrogenase/5,10-methenyltetrahydrofolate cyclohydrolase [Geitlerinema splendidum]MDK3162131.1 bifunctional 5,10-methylenetetrahydrofolate dehydrogenase/5,10-methenyltetrahydrofolate cyclohydrolase [Kamptonema cortianum]